MEAIYLDHAATTPTHPNVVEAMVPVYQKVFGNPSSIHQFGREARRLVDDARSRVAEAIGAKPKEIVFTSGGTEADNLAIIGTAMANRETGRHIITTAVEHHAVLNTCRYLEHVGFEVTYLAVDKQGRIDIQDFFSALRDDTILATIMYGNNEVGTLQPVKAIAAALKDHRAIFHTDAVQAFGVKDVDVNRLGVDLMSMTAHKINGPKGIGFLYVREGVTLVSHQHGGEQERKRRAGTLDVPGIVGLQKAVEIAASERHEKSELYARLRARLLKILDERKVNYSINGDPENGLAHIVNLYFPGTNVETLLTALDLNGVAVSSGSACTAGSIDPSHVLTAMYGLNAAEAKSSIRISFGLYNTEDQIEDAANILADTVLRMV